MKRIAYYGGSFDPLHLGHLKIASELIEKFRLDQFYFVPAFHAPHKTRVMPTSAFHRFAMLALATSSHPKEFISTIEVETSEKRYSIETLSQILLESRDAEVFFVMGADSWDEITTWKEWERLLSIVNIIVVTRPGYAIRFEHVTEEIRSRIVDLRNGNTPHGDFPKPTVFITDAVLYDISSTQIRRSIRNGEDIWDSLVPQEIAEYIRKYNLY